MAHGTIEPGPRREVMAGKFIIEIENSEPVEWYETERGIVWKTLPGSAGFKLFDAEDRTEDLKLEH